MKHVAALIALILVSLPLLAQPTVDGRFQVMTNNGSTYAVKLQIKTSSGTDDLGTSTMQFTFNNSALSFPASPTAGVDYTFHAFTGGTYGTSTVTRNLANSISVNIELNTDNAGTVVGTTYTDVVTVVFSTTNTTSNSNLAWNSAALELFDGDNSTLWTNGTFQNENTTPLPVEMTSFTATSHRLSAKLAWTTATEKNNYGFDIERKSLGTENGSWTKIGFVAGAGTKATPTEYAFEDKNVAPGRYSYRVKQMDTDGSFSYSMTSETEVGAAERVLSLSDNYPNPFNPSTLIEFTLPKDGHVSLKVYNTIGQEVASLFEGEAVAGRLIQSRFDARNLASGLYFARLEFDGKALIKKMTFLK